MHLRSVGRALIFSVEACQLPLETIARRESIRAASVNVQAFVAKDAGTRFQNVGFVRFRPGELRVEKAHEDGQRERPQLAECISCVRCWTGIVMRLNRASEDCAETRVICEGEPLPPEDRLVRRDPDWLEGLYHAHRDRLVRFAVRHTSADRAADIVQQLFMRLAGRGRDDPLEVVAPAAYLRRATINLIRDEARQAVRRCAEFHDDGVDELEGFDTVAALEARDTLARLEAIMARLKPRTREIFLAHRLDGYSYGEIATRTGLSVKAIEKHMSKAIAHVSRHLKP
ncbi:RNA polymerase sigma factor [Novosphingobium sp. ZW T3_23]|uniref:RNA polymerase sigma factor n=1 Tax=Novosphingobium sp. ZW T3_23 TaxID=3378084 RepID=UPI0038525B4B